MKYLNIVLLIIIILMSIAAGAAKVLQTPQEAEFFAAAGLGNTAMIALGIWQIAGAILAAVPKFRMAGSFVIAAGFLASVLVILMTGDLTFAVISLAPVGVAVFVGLRARGATLSTPS